MTNPTPAEIQAIRERADGGYKGTGVLLHAQGDVTTLLAALDAAVAERDDARNHTAEVALGASHYPHEEGQPCVRCERDALRERLAAAERERDEARDDAASCRRDANEWYDKHTVEQTRRTNTETERDALRQRVEELTAAGQMVMFSAYLDDNVINRHMATTVACEALRNLSAALAKGQADA